MVVNSRLEEYDGTTAVTRSQHLEPEEIEFMRWKAERWMKVRHLPAVFRHDPVFVLRNGRRMLAHTFRGTTWRSVVGLEADRDVFRRYRGIRDRERDYVDWPDPFGTVDRPTDASVRLDSPAVGQQVRRPDGVPVLLLEHRIDFVES